MIMTRQQEKEREREREREREIYSRTCSNSIGY